jgi:ankyrin repeat protein
MKQTATVLTILFLSSWLAKPVTLETRELMKACWSGDVKMVQRYIDRGGNVNYQQPEKRYTCLSAASESGHARVVALLLDAGAKKEKAYRNGKVPLHFACSRGHVNVVVALLDAGARIEARDNWSKTPLHYAARQGNTEIISELLSRGVNVNTTSSQRPGEKREIVPLYFAVEGNHVDAAKLLIEKGADTSAKRYKTQTLMDVVPGEGCEEMVALLSRHGVSRTFKPVNRSANRREPAAEVGPRNAHRSGVIVSPFEGTEEEATAALWKLLRSSEKKSPDAVEAEFKSLISAGADLSHRGRGGKVAPLQEAVFFASPKFVQLLIEAGADINVKGYRGATPVISVLRSRNRRQEIIDLLLAAGAGRASLHEGVELGNADTVKEFIRKRVDLDERDGRAYTPLHIAADLDRPAICALLLAAGANQKAELIGKSISPLEMACARGHLRVAQVLLDSLPAEDVELRAKVLPYAIISKNMDLCRAVLESGPDARKMVDLAPYLSTALFNAGPEVYDLLDETGYEWSLWASAVRGDVAAIRRAIARGEDVNAYTDTYSGMTALHAAVAKSRTNAVEFLLSANAETSLPLKNGNGCALHMAAEQNDMKLIELLLDAGANIELQVRGQTPLFMATRKGSVQAVETLVESGADLSILPEKLSGAGGQKRVPLHEQTSDELLARYLQKHGSH